MRSALYISPAASDDLENAFGYMDHALLQPSAAEDLLENFLDKASALLANPEGSLLPRDNFLRSRGIRLLPLGEYLIFYLVSEADRTIHIIRFLRNRRDWAAILQ